MKALLARFMNTEPAILFGLVRAVVYIGAGATGIAIEPDNLEQILTVVGVVLGADAATTAATRSQVTSPKTASDLVANVFVGEVGRFIRGAVTKIVPESKLTAGLQAVLPILGEFAGSALTEDTRAAIQRRVDLTLRGAGLVRTKTFGPGSMGLLILLPFLLAGCAVFAPIGGAVTDLVLGDVATLTGTDAGLVFDPVEGTTRGVVINLVAVEILGDDERCTRYVASPEFVGLDCRLGTVTEVTLIAVGAVDAFGSATYTRPGSSRPYRVGLE